MNNSRQRSQPEQIRINRISIKGSQVYISVHQNQKGTGSIYKSQISPELTRVFNERGQLGIDDEILKLASQQKIKLIGSHKSIRVYKEILSDPENLKEYSEAETGILIDNKRIEDLPTGKTYVIKMNGQTLAGVLAFKTQNGYELTPYSINDLPTEKAKFFVLRNQASQYLDYIRRNCPNYSQYNFEIQEKKNTEDYRGIAKIARWCEEQGIVLELRKTIKVDAQASEVVRVYRFKKNRELTLEAHLRDDLKTSYILYRRDNKLYTTTNQLHMVDKLKQYKLK